MKFDFKFKSSWFADFETTTEKWRSDEAKVYIWGIKKIDGELHYGLSIQSFFEFIKNKEITNIYFHNLNFDGNFIFKELLNQKINFIETTFSKEWKEAETGWTWICNKSGIFNLKVKWNKDHITTFNCSWRLTMISVEKMGQLFEEKKLELDYDNSEYFNLKKHEDVPQKLLRYLERDIDLVIKTLNKIKDHYNLAMTIASTSMKDFKKYYVDQSFTLDFGGYLKQSYRKSIAWNVLSKYDWNEIKKTYYGGYTAVNEKYKCEDLKNIDGYSYDENSAYPFIMKEMKLPFGKMYRDHPPILSVEEKKKGYGVTKFVKINMIYAYKKKKHYANILREAGRNVYNRIHYVENVENKFYSFHIDELDFIEKYYDMKYQILETFYFKTKYVFKDWVNEKKHLKETAKSAALRTYHKLILNSLYGKMGQNHVMEKKIIKNVSDLEEKDLRYKNENQFYGNEKEYTHLYIDEAKDVLSFVPIASFITTQARILLWKGMFSDIKNWIYSDTDSCYFKKRNDFLELHETQFGKWCPESRFNRFKSLRGKCYIYNQTHFFKDGIWIEIDNDYDNVVRKIAGLPKKAADLVEFDNFNFGLVIKNAKLQMMNVKNGIILMKVDFSLNKEVGD